MQEGREGVGRGGVEREICVEEVREKEGGDRE